MKSQLTDEYINISIYQQLFLNIQHVSNLNPPELMKIEIFFLKFKRLPETLLFTLNMPSTGIKSYERRVYSAKSVRSSQSN